MQMKTVQVYGSENRRHNNDVYAVIKLNSDNHGTPKFEKLRCMH